LEQPKNSRHWGKTTLIKSNKGWDAAMATSQTKELYKEMPRTHQTWDPHNGIGPNQTSKDRRDDRFQQRRKLGRKGWHVKPTS